MAKHNEKRSNQKLPNISKDHEVEYSEELADAEDREAQARAEAATQRVNKENI
ncbi:MULTISPECIES: YfhD family protein [Bacillaceae]|uniref:YfhD family protein n=1 Tax=Evansella alkalicola TaxID=745819 RepID=A0ABS6JMR5_9BACI|nr:MULTISPECIES: YfhD family protein [Bacillaceae]MBU9719856.1 YfhD family protein [Bacillus alkalicola]